MRTLIRIIFVIFIANGIDCLGGICDNCCDCFKDKDENEKIAISLVNENWCGDKKNLVLKVFEKNDDIFTSEDKKYKISIESDGKGNHKIACKNGPENKLNLGKKKYAFFEIKTKDENTVYLYCSDVESFENKNNVYGIFVKKDHKSISVIACDTEKVTNMSCMFYICSSLTELKFGKDFNTSNVRDIKGMFCKCSSLTKLDLKNFNTTSVTDMNGMFDSCKSLTELDLKNFNTENVTDMKDMFRECSKLTELKFGKDFNTSKVTYMSSMFSGCSALTELNLTNFNTSNVMSMSGMFCGCSSLTELNLTNFNTSNVMSMSGMFCGCSSLTELDLTNFNTSKVMYMNSMFYKCNKLTDLKFGGNFDTTNVMNMNEMFRNCSSLKKLEFVKKFDITNASTMYMVDNCSLRYKIQDEILGEMIVEI